MSRWRLGMIGLALVAVVATAVGCASLMHEMQPWRLRRLNQTPSRSSDAFYSVPDDSSGGHSLGEGVK